MDRITMTLADAIIVDPASDVSNGSRIFPNEAIAQSWNSSAASKRATSGPVSAMTFFFAGWPSRSDQIL